MSLGKPEIVRFIIIQSGIASTKKYHDFIGTKKTCRWPMRYFYEMLDQANVNSFIIYSLLKDNEKKILQLRKDYIRNLTI